MAHRKKPRRVDPVNRSNREQNQETLPRNNDTENQMRDALSIARAPYARRFDDGRYLAERLGSLRALQRLEIEDLRRNRRERQDIARQTYRRRDAGVAHVVGREIRTPKMREQNMPSRMRYEFQDSRGTIVCERRRARRSVIFAMQRAGKGGRRNRKARWTEKSYLVCRRLR